MITLALRTMTTFERAPKCSQVFQACWKPHGVVPGTHTNVRGWRFSPCERGSGITICLCKVLMTRIHPGHNRLLRCPECIPLPGRSPCDLVFTSRLKHERTTTGIHDDSSLLFAYIFDLSGRQQSTQATNDSNHPFIKAQLWS